MKQAEKLDVDIRFLLANERTLLAWIRTALALIVGGLALTQLDQTSRQLTSVGIVTIIAGAALAGHGYRRYRSADQAIRSGKLPRPGAGPVLQVYGIIFVALSIAIFETLRITS